MNWLDTHSAAVRIIRQCEEYELTTPAPITEAQTALTKLSQAITALHEKKAALHGAVVTAVGNDLDPVTDKPVLEALTATHLLNNMLAIQKAAENRVVHALKQNAEQYASQLVLGFEKAVKRLEEVFPSLGGLDPLDDREGYILRNTNDHSKLIAVAEAAEASQEIIARGQLHSELLALAGVITHYGIGRYTVVPIEKGIEVTPGSMQNWCKLNPVAALHKGMRLELLDRESRHEYIADFKDADAKRSAMLDERRDDHVFGRITRAGH